jgi:2-polyprenyl-6-methoxyphenol hydroxylase-like FAD-dependent oxidoreductase
MAQRLRIGIAGGGIGGLALAVSLAAAGFDPIVLERAEDLRRVQLGGSIHLWPNGNRALAVAGLYDAVRASVDDDAVVKEQSFLTNRGSRLSEWDLSEEVHGMPTLSVVRGDFHAVIADAARDMIQLNTEVVGFEQDADGVTARLTGGGEERFDILVGADGLRSKIREQIVGDTPYFAGYATWIAIIPYQHPFVLNAIRVYFGSGGRFVTWSVSDKRLYWETIFVEGEGGSDREGGHRDAVLQRVGDWVDPIRELVEATPEERILRSDSYARRAASHWGEGRVTMLGDAAHAMTNAAGQGGNQAVEDAVVLTRCLSRNDDPVAALREYESLRRKRAEKFVTRSRILARMALVRGPVKTSGRNAFMRVMGRTAYKSHSQDMAHDVGVA